MNIYIALYLSAIILANLAVVQFGPSISIFTAFLAIGLDLTVRDYLHEKWQGSALWRNMAILIGSGSVLSYAINRNAGPIALASFTAFALAGITDALIYHRLHSLSRLLRINGSNIPSALVDSMIFPALAFGFPLLWPIMLGQFLAKVFGGLIWSLVLKKQ